MFNKDTYEKIKRLNFEDLLCIIFIIISILNISANNMQKKYVQTKKEELFKKSNKIFEITITITLIIYIYYFIRNISAYKKSNNKEDYMIKLLGSSFMIAGVLCLLYFQNKNETFIGSPTI